MLSLLFNLCCASLCTLSAYFFPRATSEGFSFSTSSAGAGTFAPEKFVTHPTRIRPMENGNPLSILAPRPPGPGPGPGPVTRIQNIYKMQEIYTEYTKYIQKVCTIYTIYIYIYNIHTIYIQYIYIQNIRDANFEPNSEVLFPEYGFYSKIEAYNEVRRPTLCRLFRISAQGLPPKRVP